MSTTAGGVVRVGQVDVVLAVLAGARAREPEVGVRGGAAGAEQAAAAPAVDRGGLLGGPAGRERPVGGADEGGGVAAAAVSAVTGLPGSFSGEDRLVGRRLLRVLAALAASPFLASSLAGAVSVSASRRGRSSAVPSLSPAPLPSPGGERGVRGLGDVGGAGRRAQQAGALDGQPGGGLRRGARRRLPGAVSAAKPVTAASAVAAPIRDRVVRFTADSPRVASAWWRCRYSCRRAGYVPSV